MQTNATSSNLVRSRKNLCETPKHDRVLMYTNWMALSEGGGSGGSGDLGSGGGEGERSGLEGEGSGVVIWILNP